MPINIGTLLGKNQHQKKQQYLYSLTGKRIPEKIGNKAANLQRLISKKFLIPDTYVLSWDAYLDYQDRGETALEDIETELRIMLNPEMPYAVRSSANVEDSPNLSFAGQPGETFHTGESVAGWKMDFPAGKATAFSFCRWSSDPAGDVLRSNIMVLPTCMR